MTAGNRRRRHAARSRAATASFTVGSCLRADMRRHAAGGWLMPVRGLTMFGLALLLAHAAARADTQSSQPASEQMRAACRQAAEQVESTASLPPGMMLAIARTETGRPDPRSAAIEPWPWTVNQNGEGRFFATSHDAVAWTSAQLHAGRRSIDVGCFQVNLLYHPDAFASLESAFDPVANAAFAAGFLRRLYTQGGSWESAIAAYHSSDPLEGQRYSGRVLALWRGTVADTPLLRTAASDPVVIRLASAASAVRVVVPDWAATQRRIEQPPPRPGLPRVYGPTDH
jgi:hypothetical protein